MNKLTPNSTAVNPVTAPKPSSAVSPVSASPPKPVAPPKPVSSPKFVNSPPPVSQVNKPANQAKPMSQAKPISQTKPINQTKPLNTTTSIARQTNSANRLNTVNTHSQVHKRMVENKAIKAVRNSLYNQGFHSVRQLQYNKVHGQDLMAIKYASNGRIQEAKAFEVKGRSSPTASVGRSAVTSRQTTPAYLERNMLKAKNAKLRDADKLYKLAKDGKIGIYGATYHTLKDKGKGPRYFKFHESRNSNVNKSLKGEVKK